MSMGFEIQESDVLVALVNAGVNNANKYVEEVFDGLIFELVEDAALYSTDMDEQVAFAHSEIIKQAREMEIIPDEEWAKKESSMKP